MPIDLRNTLDWRIPLTYLLISDKDLSKCQLKTAAGYLIRIRPAGVSTSPIY